MNDITLAPVLDPEDIESVLRLEDAFKAEIGEAPLAPPAHLALRAAIQSGRIRFFAAMHLSRMVGMCSVSETFSTFTCGKCGVFEDFYLYPPYRHRGIARRLVRFVQEACQLDGYASLTVGASECDVPMYASLGFHMPIGTMLACPLAPQSPEDGTIRFVESPGQKVAIAGSILAALPEWFGIPESTRRYVDECRAQPFFAAVAEDAAEANAENALGFAALKQTGPRTAEIAVMGVLPQYHRAGIGSSLFRALKAYAEAQGYAFLQVKTVQMGRYDEYDRTNRFYKRMGFTELECFPTLWDEHNPCQVYVMALGRSS